MTELRLRPETEADLPFLERLYASTRLEELRPVPWSEAQKAEFLSSQFSLQRSHYLTHYPDANLDVVELRGAPVGRLYVQRQSDELRVMDIALLPEYQRQGVGGRLLKPLLEEAGQAELPVTLHVEHQNQARLWYERLGFVVVEDIGVYLLMRWQAPG